ncbi:MAG: hypothetical protein WBE40_06375 [Thermoplasmata archaeon]
MSAGVARGAHLPIYALLVVVGVTVSTLGLAAALATQISEGTAESGQGAYVAQSSLTYWNWEGTLLGTIPLPVPRTVSTAVATPTVLPAGRRSYTVNAGTAGQTSVEWTFGQGVSAPTSTELVITFVLGLNHPVVTISIYVETNARASAAVSTYHFYWDAGTFAPGSLAIETMTATVQVCTSIGTCP